MTKEEAIELMILDERHEHYTRTVNLANEYHDLLLCNDLGRFSKVYRLGESEEEHNQRLEIYITVIPSLLAEVGKYFNKPLRLQHIHSDIGVEKNEQEGRVLAEMEKFYNSENNRGVDNFLQEKWDYYCKYDPNALISIESDSENIFPYIYESKNVLNYKLKNGYLVWAIVASEDMLLLYDEDGTHTLKPIENKKEAEGELIVDNFSFYDYHYYKNNYGYLRMKFAGVVKDPETKYDTYVSLFQSGIPYLKKEIQTGSEFDLTMRKHAFPQKVFIGRPCTGTPDTPCNNGRSLDGTNCVVCKGTGRANNVQESSAQVLEIKQADRKEEQIYPNEIIHYYSPPVELIKFQKEYMDSIHENFRRAMFSQSLIKTDGSGLKTATEVRNEADNLGNTLFPFVTKYSNLWMFITDAIIEYTLLGVQANSYHSFPEDLIPKSDIETLEDLKAMKEAGAPQSILSQLQLDWIGQRYSTDAETLVKVQTQAKFQPFFGKTDDEVRMILAGNVNREISTLHNYFHHIFTELEEEVDNFYYLLHARQKQLIDEKVKSLMPEELPMIDTTGLFNFDEEQE